MKLGEKIYTKAKPMGCHLCHGHTGAGNGKLAKSLNPPPRNFKCAMMKEISPGQLFWVIKFGSKGTSMGAHKDELTDKEIWSVVKHIRFLSNQKN